MATFATVLAPKLGIPAFDVRWRTYLPEAMQAMHVTLVLNGAKTIAPRAPVKKQARRMIELPKPSDGLLSL